MSFRARGAAAAAAEEVVIGLLGITEISCLSKK